MINKIKTVLLLAFLMICSSILAQRKHVNIDDNWKFSFGHAANPALDFNYGIKNSFSKSGASVGTAIESKFDDKNWKTVHLPHDWAVGLPFAYVDHPDVESHGYKPVGGLFPATSIGWYRKQLYIDRADSGKRFQIQFDGVFRDAEVWINGFYLGNNKSGYLGMSYDVTDFLNYGKKNLLTVRVNATQYEGWFYEGAGIYRHVWLNSYPDTHVATDGVFAHAAIHGKTATLTISTTVANEQSTTDTVLVRTTLRDRGGNKVGRPQEQPLLTASTTQKTLTQQIQVNNPILWNLDQPYLYRVVVELVKKGKVTDRQTLRFGFRTIEITPQGVFLNGHYIKLLGTNNHQDHAGVGSALPDYLQYYRINLLKEMGCNAYRTSHNAPTPELLDACDSLGMLVLDEQRLLNSGQEYMEQFEKLVKRDRSRPSVFLWSIGNEEGWIHTTATGKRIAQTFITRLRQLDPTRTCTYAADLPNVFNGVNEVIPVRSFNYRQFAVADYHKDHPLQPIIGTEMGSTVTTRGIYEKDSIRCYLPDKDVTAPWWASTAENWWPLAANNNYWLGGFIWTGFDYRGEPTPFKWPNISSHFGVMDVCGFPKNLYYYYQSWWTDKDVLQILPHWNWPGKEGQPIDVWVYSNAEQVELFLNGQSLGQKTMPMNGHLQWSVNYSPGTLKAVGIKKGKKIEAKVETTGQPAGIVVTPHKTTLLADGKDATVINISVVDKQGREVPDAGNLIHFSLKGDARILGVGNGDPSSHEPDQCEDGQWQRSLFNGKCQLILQAGTNADLVHFEASAEGLWKGGTDVYTVQLSLPSTANSTPVKSTASRKEIGKMLGADISFLPELESKGMEFSQQGVKKDALMLLKEHGINYIRLRIFNNPADSNGYAPKKGFCDLEHTLQFARRIKQAGLKWLLDFHYSDTWADPGKQFKPKAWQQLPFPVLKDSLAAFTRQVMLALKAQGTLPDMVQIGNEINHGMVWPEGSVSNFDGLAALYNAGRAAVLEVAPPTIIMLHIALGGQPDESVFFLDNMLARGVQFDVLGQSYYPQWHGSLPDLKNNLNRLIACYQTDVIVVEYSAKKEEVNRIVFELPQGRGKGSFIWEPLNTWEKIFDDKGRSNEWLPLYDRLKREYLE